MWYRRMVPCQILTLAVTAWYNILFSTNRIMSTPLLSKQLLIYPRNECLCLPIFLFPSVFPVTIWYYLPFFLGTCPKKLHCLCSICFMNCLSVWAFLSTSSFVIFFIQEIFIIFRKKHIPVASSCFFIALFIVHISHPYIIELRI